MRQGPQPRGLVQDIQFCVFVVNICFISLFFFCVDLVMPRVTSVVCGDRVLFRDSRGFFPGAVTSVCEDTVIITLDPDEEFAEGEEMVRTDMRSALTSRNRQLSRDREAAITASRVSPVGVVGKKRRAPVIAPVRRKRFV